jgi:hypothetical protein
MKRVTGIGGIFFKSENQEQLYQWYEKHLGVTSVPEGTGAAFEWRDLDDPQKKGMTVWAIFPQHTKYFDPSRSGFMINYRVDNLDALLTALKEEGVEIDPQRTTTTAASPGSWTRKETGSSCGSRRKKSSASRRQ